jgi:Bacterial mobilisation protein (MobC)
MARLKRSDRVERRTAFMGTNVTPGEREEARRRAANMGRRLSDFLRLMALSDRFSEAMQPKLPPEVGLKLAFELARIGTNLNQLSHHANLTGAMPERVALNATLDEIVKATEALTRL